ncbi:MAG: bifunctional methionine sulfoxide reductase B/A protein [Chlorobiaceae bacterium]|nr:bifunctional methionine sulfoxide reductase B/A protein [Chlorobiaceae bacterium]NTV60642.1 bifunctional methionine sulfoxide reductase B/A protein [Chlorobiaceae bacterium]
MRYNDLTPDEERVIVNKGTERPFSGEYYRNKDDGTYLCKRCNAPLFRSNDKFESGTGWPSFDDAIEGAVKQIPDADGSRTEILCANCGAHLGHVFFGEGMTGRNVRHCVNSISLCFMPEAGTEKTTQKAVFAGGCFWGVEYHFSKLKGVLSVKSGYTGGKTEDPSYKEVCTGKTGHAEAVEIEFDPSVVSYETLAKLFFEIHDPSELNRQGPDIGTQYRSALFYTSEEQKAVAEKLVGILKEKGFNVVTTLEKAGKFWVAEEYHQDYYARTGHQPYCHVYRKRF